MKKFYYYLEEEEKEDECCLPIFNPSFSLKAKAILEKRGFLFFHCCFSKETQLFAPLIEST